MPRQMKLVPVDIAQRLVECPPGLFIVADGGTPGDVGFKSEYGANSSDMECYCVGSGEAFWGGTNDRHRRCDILVYPAELKLIEVE